jgi:hypothetical protein
MLALLALLPLALGCGDDDCCSSQIDARDPDAVTTVDADPSCAQWRRVPVDITDVVSAEANAIHPERSARMLVTVEQCPGDLPAQPEYGFTLENEYVALRMSVWRRLADCTAPTTTTRPVTIKFLYAGGWKFLLAGGGTRTITVVGAPNTQCITNTQQCDQDCDCTGADVCLSTYGFGGPFARCARPCELDRDCGGDGRCESPADELPFVCQPGTECASPTDCPTGFGCTAGTCEPTFQLNGSSRHACTCDAECDPGLRCTFHEGASTGRCEALCLTETSAWCEGPHVCGAGSVEPIPGVCAWVGE